MVIFSPLKVTVFFIYFLDLSMAGKINYRPSDRQVMDYD